jgi:hypothetical protein
MSTLIYGIAINDEYSLLDLVNQYKKTLRKSNNKIWRSIVKFTQCNNVQLNYCPVTNTLNDCWYESIVIQIAQFMNTNFALVKIIMKYFGKLDFINMWDLGRKTTVVGLRIVSMEPRTSIDSCTFKNQLGCFDCFDSFLHEIGWKNSKASIWATRLEYK